MGQWWFLCKYWAVPQGVPRCAQPLRGGEVLRRPAVSSRASVVCNSFGGRPSDWAAISSRDGLVSSNGSFARAASFVGHLIEWGLLSNDLVRQHLIKPLTNHYYYDTGSDPEIIRANVIYQLFIAAGNTLLQGLLKAEDVQVCFEMLDAQASAKKISGFDAAKLKELREIHAAWMQRKQGEEQGNVRDTEGLQAEGQDAMAAEVPAEVETPVAFVPQDLPAAMIGIEIPSSILQDIVSPSVLHAMESPFETSISFPAATVSSPTFSISTISDLAPTDLGEEIEHSQELTTTHHDTFYFEDGNVEGHRFVFLPETPGHPFSAWTPSCSNSGRTTSDRYLGQC
ncbi:hypothetical protein BDM02DRAFT_3119300 [Thelephora ganbajun]|uniref:Uncharacterized protein n=1 Tax=Thelephora ganbajun TaxID=370292 RepID=A0ACB6Z988_THEGA|nr:hypothetical protein BDM02DRAFT_3119300 [Thelephora ganbajun]